MDELLRETTIFQGESISLTDEELVPISDIFAKRNINLECINQQEHLVTFPQQYVGYLSLPKRKITILPKNKGITLEHILRIYYFLICPDNADFDDSLFDINSKNGNSLDISKLFLSELDSLRKKGLSVDYKINNGNLKQMRGKVDFIKTTFNKDIGCDEPFSCTYSDLTKDNNLNRILKAALYKIQSSCSLNSNNRLLKMFEGVSNKYSLDQLNITKKTSYCKRAASLAIIILQDLSVSELSNGSFGENLLVNFDLLFERFVQNILLYHSGDYNFAKWDNEEDFAYYTAKNGMEQFKTYKPDLLYAVDEKSKPITAQVILDMKNKTSSPFSNDDIYQMLFYATQLHSKRIILCYPSSSILPISKLNFIENVFPVKYIFAAYLNIAGNSSFEFKQNIQKFIDDVRNLI